MTEDNNMQEEDAHGKTDWNEEYDAWLELIEDHLKSIRRSEVAIIILLIILILAQVFPWIAIYLDRVHFAL